MDNIISAINYNNVIVFISLVQGIILGMCFMGIAKNGLYAPANTRVKKDYKRLSFFMLFFVIFFINMFLVNEIESCIDKELEKKYAFLLFLGFLLFFIMVYIYKRIKSFFSKDKTS
jgi:hypothetical protein